VFNSVSLKNLGKAYVHETGAGIFVFTTANAAPLRFSPPLRCSPLQQAHDNGYPGRGENTSVVWIPWFSPIGRPLYSSIEPDRLEVFSSLPESFFQQFQYPTLDQSTNHSIK
jgi:hypothetical protein